MHKFILEKLWAIYLIFKKLPKVNNRPIGENTPNLVTLNMLSYCIKASTKTSNRDSTYVGTYDLNVLRVKKESKRMI
jgi:hypothetical protein